MCIFSGRKEFFCVHTMIRMPDNTFVKYFIKVLTFQSKRSMLIITDMYRMKEWEICNSSARAIRKTALRAYCGYRHCFTHLQALSS